MTSGKKKRVSVCVPVCVLAVCSRVCSAWSRSLTSSSKASCSLLLFLFSFFRRFWMRTELRTREKGEKKSEHVQIKWSNIFILHLILIYCQNWFIYFYWLFFVHVLPVSWNSWIFMSGNLRDFEGIVSLACLLCSCSLNKIFMHFCDKTEVLLLSQTIKHLTPIHYHCSRLICVSEFISSTSYKLLLVARAQQSLTGIFSHCKAYSCDLT